MSRICHALILVVFSLTCFPSQWVYASSETGLQAIETIPGRIAFVDELGNIWVFDGTTGQTTQITQDAKQSTQKDSYFSIRYSGPKWSPDGNLLLFSKNEVDQNNDKTELLIFNLDRKSIIATLSGKDRYASWSPDGKSIIYGKAIELNADYTFKDPGGIWQFNLENLTESEIIPPFSKGPLIKPTWSPDGKYISFYEVIGNEGMGRLWVWEKASGNTISIQSPNNTVGNCAWMPNDTLVIDEINYVTFPGAGVYQINPDGTNPHLLLANADKAVLAPLPSPDGQVIAVTMENADPGTEVSKLLLVSPSAGNPRQIGNGMPIDWSPDGNYLLTMGQNGGSAQIINIRSGSSISAFSLQTFDADWGPATVTTVNLTPWIKEKGELIEQLQNVTIKTSFLSIPAFGGLDESNAKKILSDFETQGDNVPPDQKEAFIRMVLQERSLAGHLELISATTASQSEIFVSSIKTLLGFRYTLNSAWQVCRGKLSLCAPEVEEQVDKMIWKSVKGFGLIAIPLYSKTTGNTDSAKNVWEITITALENKLDSGASLKDLLVDSSIEALTTRLLIQKYLSRNQQFVDRGTHTVNPQDGQHVDLMPITGDARRAELMVKEMQELAQNQHDIVESRHEDFRKGANIAQTASDIAALGQLTPAVLIAKTVSIVSAVEKMAIDVTELTINSKTIDCMEYLNQMGAVYAFDAQQTPVSCEDRSIVPPTGSSISMVVFHPSVFMSPMKARFNADALAYHEAINDLKAALQTGSDKDIQLAVKHLMVEQDRLAQTLDIMETSIAEKGNLSSEEAAFIGQSNGFMLNGAVLYLSAVETALAKQSGKQDNTFEAFAATHVQQLDQIQTAANAMTLPQSSSLVNVPTVGIEKVTLQDGNRLNITVRNGGQAKVSEVHVVARTANGETTNGSIPAIPANSSQAVVFNHPNPRAGAFIIELWQGQTLADTWMGSLTQAAEPTGISPNC